MSNLKVVPASFSSIEAYQTCPRRFYETKLAKNFVEPETDAILWGNQTHKALEERGRDKAPLGERFKQYEWIAQKLEAAPGDHYYEHKLAVNYQLKPTEFFAEDAYVRGVEDILIVNDTKALSGDYKTGKKKPKSRQLELSALRVFANFPRVETVTTTFFWLASSPVAFTVKQYHRSQIDALWQPFIQDIKQMEWSLVHDVWPAKPSGLCKRSRTSSYQGCIVASCPHSEFYRK